MSRKRIERGVVLAIAICGLLSPLRAEVQLRSREGNTRLGNRRSHAKSRVPSHSHLVLDFQEPPNAETVRQLARRGMRVVAYLPVTGVVVGFDGDADLAGLNLAGYDALQPEDKISPELAAHAADSEEAKAFYIVEFHEDVPWEDRRALLTEAGLEIRDHRDLVAGHMLVLGTLSQVRAVAEWDEVGYVFPASGELSTGLPLIGCLGGATEAGQVGQLTQRVGEGWDGPGLGIANLSYSLQALTKKIPAEQVQQEIQRAMAEWSSVVKVNFQRGTVSSATKNINILFGSRDHGDPYAFDGAGRILAHTFYPAPPNPEPIAGDLHFDDDENWNVGADIDLYSVALHELGHALGLGHSDVPNAVMYPYYRRATNLTAEDIAAIRLLYAAADPTPAPPPLAPLLLAVTSPAASSTTTATTVAISGTLKGARGVAAVRWTAHAGETGEAVLTADGAGGFSWTASAIPVVLGENTVTLRASDEASRTTSATVQIQRLAPPVTPTPNPPPTPNPNPTPNPPAVAPLELEVLTPAPAATVTQNPITASGTSGGGTGRPTIRWSSDRGFSGTAVVAATTDGRYRWDINPLAVQPGVNLVTVTATDTAGKSTSKTVRVTYTVPTEPAPGPGGDDTRPPSIAITSPNTSFLMTPAYAIAVRGTATDASGVAEVRWECSCGSQGRAQGASQWTIPNISLPLGSHTIKIFAKDQVGNEGMASFTVFRYQN